MNPKYSGIFYYKIKGEIFIPTLSRMIAEVNKNRCVACGTCIKPCPKEAITIWKGCYAVVDLEKCVGCGKCVRVCPADCITRKERGAV